MLSRYLKAFRGAGSAAASGAAGQREVDLAQAMPGVQACADVFAGGRGLEIGGPSDLFRTTALPIYALAREIDACNFGEQTIWEGELRDGGAFVFDPLQAPGRQFVGEGSQLAQIADASYDYLLSCHSLEHMANPLQALANWRRVLRPDGVLLLVLPHRDGTFDHRRPVTTLQHLIEDFEAGRGEDDLTHLAEIVELLDPGPDAAADWRDKVRAECLRNRELRTMHHHVFDTYLAVDMVDHAGFQIVYVQPATQMHIIVIARNTAQLPDNAAFLGRSAPPCWSSPFPTDHGRR
jgi:SAM-dependent methyltransferase